MYSLYPAVIAVVFIGGILAGWFLVLEPILAPFM